jgi:hypothetical protein
MTNGASAPLKMVERKRRPVIMEKIIPARYMEKITVPAPAPKKVPARIM